jgi:lysophospholipase L1-like esterase
MALLVAAVLLIASSRTARADALGVTVGDSIVKTYPEPYDVPIQGWGAKLRLFTSGAVWVNQAVGGTSTKSYVERGYWSIALSGNPKWVLIQFGYADASADPEGHTDPATYRANLHQMILDCRAIGAEATLVTPTAIRATAPDGIHVDRPGALAPYADAMIAQAQDDGVRLIDMYHWSLDLYDAIGMSQAQALYGFDTVEGPPDLIHFSVFGATEAAKMVASRLPGLGQPAVAVFPYDPREPATPPCRVCR